MILKFLNIDKDNFLYSIVLLSLLSIIFFSVTSCGESKECGNYKKIMETDEVREFTYDGCEYIQVGYSNGAWGSHKGNCKNPIHQRTTN
jgi:hypothetical protein